MNFYFCESCGRRVTDKDLEAGAARNKQVKGVYCDDCAPGVSTITFEALREEQLNIERPVVSQGNTQPLPAKHRPKAAQPAQPASSRRAMIAGTAILLALALSLMLAARQDSHRPAVAAANQPSRVEPDTPPASAPENKPPSDPAPARIPTPPEPVAAPTPPTEPIAAAEPEKPPVPEPVSQTEVNVPDVIKVEPLAQPVLPVAPEPEKKVDVAAVVVVPDKEPAPAPKPAPANEYIVTLQKGQQVPKFKIAKYSAVTDCFLYKAWKDVPYMKYTKLLEEKKLLAQDGWHVPLIRFAVFRTDGGVLPNDAEIVEAKLSLYKASLYTSSIDLYSCLSPWDVDHVGWLHADKTRLWKTPGGDASNKPVSSFVTRRDAEWCEFDVTSSVVQIQKEKRNFGWFIRSSGAINQLRFHTSEADDETLRPKLTIKIREKR